MDKNIEKERNHKREQKYHLDYFGGKLGRGGIIGSFILGNVFMFPNKGFGGGNKFGVMPPFAKGIYGGIEGIFENLSPSGCGGLWRSRDGILFELFGLFSANNL